MIYHRGGEPVSEQHTDLLICHWTKQDLSRTSRYLGITYTKQAGQLAIVNVAIYELSSTLKS